MADKTARGMPVPLNEMLLYDENPIEHRVADTDNMYIASRKTVLLKEMTMEYKQPNELFF